MAKKLKKPAPRITDRMIVTALHCIGSRWSWMAMPRSLRADLRSAFKIIATANESMALRRRADTQKASER